LTNGCFICANTTGWALPSQNRPHDLHPHDPGDIAEHLVQLQIHLLQGLLHQLNLHRGPLHQVLAVSPVATQHTDRIGRAKRPCQHPVGMQLLKPLAILHVGLAARQVLGLAGIHQVDLDPVLLQHLHDRNPVHPGRFDGHRGHATRLEPLGHRL
jgi:hypothetical protein